MPFRKGVSGNPGGRPKTKPFYVALDMEIKAAGEDHKKLRTIARKLLEKAESGDLAAIKEIADRLDGKSSQSHELGGQGGQPIQIVISSDDNKL